MSVLAIALRERGELRQDTLVATVMSNLGMFQAMERAGVEVRKTAVGDRYILEEMIAGGYSLGGEQSGHMIFLDHATTGDGTLTGLLLAARVAQSGRSLRELAAVMTRLPQVLYRATLTLSDERGRRLGGYVSHSGIRRITVTPDGRLALNGRPVDVRGVELHEQSIATGGALAPDQLAQLVGWVRALGATVIRTEQPKP